jgi:hypothetical protein
LRPFLGPFLSIDKKMKELQRARFSIEENGLNFRKAEEWLKVSKGE